MAKIENYRYSVDEAFRECFYIVPDYQREDLIGKIEKQLKHTSKVRTLFTIRWRVA